MPSYVQVSEHVRGQEAFPPGLLRRALPRADLALTWLFLPYTLIARHALLLALPPHWAVWLSRAAPMAPREARLRLLGVMDMAWPGGVARGAAGAGVGWAELPPAPTEVLPLRALVTLGCLMSLTFYELQLWVRVVQELVLLGEGGGGAREGRGGGQVAEAEAAAAVEGQELLDGGGRGLQGRGARGRGQGAAAAVEGQVGPALAGPQGGVGAAAAAAAAAVVAGLHVGVGAGGVRWHRRLYSWWRGVWDVYYEGMVQVGAGMEVRAGSGIWVRWELEGPCYVDWTVQVGCTGLVKRKNRVGRQRTYTALHVDVL